MASCSTLPLSDMGTSVENVVTAEGEGSEKKEEDEEEEEQEAIMALCILLLKKRIHWLPIITAIFIISAFFISYGVSVSQGHVEPDFPYISHTAILAPERCIFAQLVNIGAFLRLWFESLQRTLFKKSDFDVTSCRSLSGANIYVRFLQQMEIFKTSRFHHSSSSRNFNRRGRRLCIASLIVGWLSAFGLSMVANFQTNEMRPAHYTGAGLAFVLGLAYCWLQTTLSLRDGRRGCVACLQVLNSTLLSCCLVTFAVSKSIFKIREGKKHGTKEDVLRPVYLVSTVSEWLTALSIVFFVLTFYPSFKRISLLGPRVQLLEDPPRPAVNGNALPWSMSNGQAV
ncbi:DNA damage-regulated autophagy modulator protein 1-like [Pomacea canaliculata]|uniref:DNA damage-regulated autophagy modulator protein 1-like n=1 Tax=Pomacea canaliculata TaxID=400727 RepID=UPI000D73900C|nr:DNA damage-regulated autophagy modulator protein 1-like [Pomacea canaliculata]